MGLDMKVKKVKKAAQEGKKDRAAKLKAFWKAHGGLTMTLVKYGFALLLTAISCFYVKSTGHFFIQFFELLSIILVTDLIAGKNRIVGSIVSDICFFFYNMQTIVLIYAHHYITLVMLTNIDSWRALSGNAFTYVSAILLVLVLSFLPVEKIKWMNKKNLGALCLSLAIELVCLMGMGGEASPLQNMIAVGDQYLENKKVLREISKAPNMSNRFFHKDVPDIYPKPDNLPDNPNVILIFVEGLSQNIVLDEREIMPNVAEFEEKSLNFTHYYNHTFATYRGISGQLFSGYQLENYDVNSLVSIQEILSYRGYHTSIINTEPQNAQFLKYMQNLGFDEVISDPDGPGHIPDREAFEILFDTCMEQSKKNEPFFTVIYTFGTHASQDSPNKKFDDDIPELNKFYNLDYWFGDFIEKLEDSDLKDNTLVVFTADHATYVDKELVENFPDYIRYHYALDEVPLFFYYSGIEPKEIDAMGRNSLDLAPTILDYIDISEPNYFLGSTLFLQKQNANNFDTIFCEGTYLLYSSDQGTITELSETDAQYKIVYEDMKRYYAAAKQEPVSWLRYVDDPEGFMKELNGEKDKPKKKE